MEQEPALEAGGLITCGFESHHRYYGVGGEIGRRAGLWFRWDKFRVSSNLILHPILYAEIVQLVERLPCKQYVQGSSPCFGSYGPLV